MGSRQPENTLKCAGKRALVTGGGSGIGYATVKMLAALGASVAINHLPGDEEAEARIRELASRGHDVVAVAGDVSDPHSARELVREAIDRLGGLDFLVNNAGTSGTPEPIPFSKLEAMTEEFWGRILATNLQGPFRCTTAAAEALKLSRGAVVNVASIAGLGRRGSSIAYAASKAALINLTHSLAVAMAPDVRVNAVAPGFVASGWTSRWPAERRRRAAESSLLGRVAEPEDIAEVIFFLLVNAGYVNAQTIVVDGGHV